MKARLLDAHEIAPGVRHFVFDVPALERLAFIPGQFVSLTEEFEGKEITRAYSIASAPDGNRFELCLNLVEQGRFSPHLFSMKPGDTVEMSGPLGYFTLRQPANDSLFVATGTGIAPFRGIVKEALSRAPSHSYTLILGARHEHGLLYRDEFDAAAREHPNFRFWPTLSRPAADWAGRTGYVQAHVLEAAAERRDIDVYICGLKAMVDEARARLKEAGFDRRRLIYEKYD